MGFILFKYEVSLNAYSETTGSDCGYSDNLCLEGWKLYTYHKNQNSHKMRDVKMI